VGNNSPLPAAALQLGGVGSLDDGAMSVAEEAGVGAEGIARFPYPVCTRKAVLPPADAPL